MMHQKICKTCHRSFEASHRGRRFCSWQCAKYKAPAVYRFICPDGRSYVGAVADIRKRFDRGIARSNPWLDAAFKLHPPETWTYEILERLPPSCSIPRLREAEQRHIDHLGCWKPDTGFNMNPPVWAANGPMQKEARCRSADQTRTMMARKRAEWAAHIALVKQVVADA